MPRPSAIPVCPCPEHLASPIATMLQNTMIALAMKCWLLVDADAVQHDYSMYQQTRLFLLVLHSSDLLESSFKSTVNRLSGLSSSVCYPPARRTTAEVASCGLVAASTLHV